MTSARFLLVHPDCDAHPSGGNRYNRHLLEEARSHGWLLGSVTADPAVRQESAEALGARIATTSWADRPGLIIWDSLFLGAAPPLPRNDTHQAVLLHFLPSQNPLLSSSARAAARSAEDRWIDRMDCVITTGKCLENLVVHRYPAVRVYRCQPGVDELFWQVGRCKPPGARGALGLLSVGNLSAAKGYTEVLDALDRLASPDWRWHIAGSDRLDATFAAHFLARARPWIRAGRIVYYGALSDLELAGLMARVDLFVSASHFESYGMALAEAVAADLTVVATDVGDTVSIARKARSAWVIPAGDSTALAAALSEATAALEKGLIKAVATEGHPFPNWSEVFSRFRDICETQVGLARAP